MDLLKREGILDAKDLPHERVSVPEWGGDVLVRALTAEERDAYEAGCFVGEGRERRSNFANLRARLLVLALVDEEGQPLFTPAAADALGQKSAAVVERLYDVAARLSGLRESDVEELLGNFKPGPGGATSSA